MTMRANFVGSSVVSAITHTPASGPLGPVTTPPMALPSMRTAPPAPCWALSVRTEPAHTPTIATIDAHIHSARLVRMALLLSWLPISITPRRDHSSAGSREAVESSVTTTPSPDEDDEGVRHEDPHRSGSGRRCVEPGWAGRARHGPRRSGIRLPLALGGADRPGDRSNGGPRLGGREQSAAEGRDHHAAAGA